MCRSDLPSLEGERVSPDLSIINNHLSIINNQSSILQRSGLCKLHQSSLITNQLSIIKGDPLSPKGD
ncbi:MAG: hypothetical protein U9P88_02195, partial [Patescibacteria group bacterium]|nr:hypothetical protein [Patescibacteria group bacterium]